jgi:glutamate/tyrosine decarboxylase-like PLP-dependent enzyme
VAAALELVAVWERGFGPPITHPALVPEPGRLRAAWDEFGRRMAGNFPFFHPRYAGQMLKPPHPVAVAGYVAAMLVNPNNHSLDGGPVTSEMEKETVAALAAMFHMPAGTLGHLTTSGTIANLEALWVARELAPGRAVLSGAHAHYTHGRMCELLGVRSVVAATDDAGRLDLDDVARRCERDDVGTVVLTAGSTGLGTVDRIDEALALRDRFGVRLHVDAAYGGLFSLLAWDDGTAPLVPAAALRAVAACDSVVVDPHKHGLQPYGCGAVLFADPGVGALYRHDAPYTYFTSDDLHLGEISLECSRAGAAAAALWLTLRTFPLDAREGLGPVLAAGRRAALALAAKVSGLGREGPLRLHVEPELDIVTYFPWRPGATAGQVGRASGRMLSAGMRAQDPVWLSTLRLGGGDFSAAHPDVVGPTGDGGEVTVVRSVLMKPEHEAWVGALFDRLLVLGDESLAGG